MKVKFLSLAKYISRFFEKNQKNEERQARAQDDTRKKMLNHFIDEGFSFWQDPYHFFRKNFVIRAGPLTL